MEVTREIRTRIRELKPAQPTRSPIWFLEMNARNAEIAQERALKAAKDGDCADLLKAATLALAEGRRTLVETEGLMTLAAGTPQALDDQQRAALRRRLSTPITVPGHEVSREETVQ